MKFKNAALVVVALALSLSLAHSCFAMNWTQINTDGFGDPNNQALKAAYFNEQMYFATGKEPNEDDPGTQIRLFVYDGSVWTPVNVDEINDNLNNVMGGIGMAVYQDLMYIGTKNEVNGTELWSYDGSSWSSVRAENNSNYAYCKLEVYNNKLYFASGYGDPPISRLRVLAYDGETWTNTNFNDDNVNEKIDDLAVFDGKLYLSTYSQGDGFQIWAYDENAVGEKWALIADAGIEDPDNHVCFNMSVDGNRLLANTANLVTGGQLWAYESEEWSQINTSGFGNVDNLSVMASSIDDQLFAGTYNMETGGELWMLNGTDWLQVNSSADFNNSPYLIVPGRFIDQLALYVISNQGVGIYTHSPPTANAGADQTVMEAASVVLDGSGSSSSTGNTYLWTQLSGETVTLSDATVLSPSFTSPETGPGGDTLVFSLAVTDNGGLEVSDQVTITVSNQCTITTTAQGNGAISLDPAGSTHAEGTPITLTAEPEDGYQFDSWEGDASGSTNPLSITLNSDMSVTAVFVEDTGGSGGGGGGGGGGCFISTLD